MNDFSATALGVTQLPDGDLLRIHPGRSDPAFPVGVLGAGTGLGEAVLVPCDGRFHVLATEGGHGDFAPQDAEQTGLFQHLQEQFGHVSWERVLSGPGLVNIFTFLGGEPCDPAELAAMADSGDERARRAVRIFIDVYGSEAGNMALRLLGRGGIYIAGGIAARNPDWFTDGTFTNAYLRKGRFREVVGSIPVYVVMNPEAGLLGALAEARRIAGS
jgi:glucokinase